MAADCKSAGDAYGGSNPPLPTILRLYWVHSKMQATDGRPSKSNEAIYPPKLTS